MGYITWISTSISNVQFKNGIDNVAHDTLKRYWFAGGPSYHSPLIHKCGIVRNN